MDEQQKSLQANREAFAVCEEFVLSLLKDQSNVQKSWKVFVKCDSQQIEAVCCITKQNLHLIHFCFEGLQIIESKSLALEHVSSLFCFPENKTSSSLYFFSSSSESFNARIVTKQETREAMKGQDAKRNSFYPTKFTQLDEQGLFSFLGDQERNAEAFWPLLTTNMRSTMLDLVNTITNLSSAEYPLHVLGDFDKNLQN